MVLEMRKVALGLQADIISMHVQQALRPVVLSRMFLIESSLENAKVTPRPTSSIVAQ
jgi:hypothetical protein